MPSFRSFSVGSAGHEPTAEELARFELMRQMWAGPAENVIPVAYAFTAVVGRSDQAAIAVVGGQVYPTGLAFRLIATTRVAWPGPGPGGILGIMGHHAGRTGFVGPGQVLRFGVRYPDGRVADSLGDGPPFADLDDIDLDKPRLISLGGGGGDRRWEQHMFLTPLPPEGLLELVCQWPGLGIVESHVTIDLVGLTGALDGVVELWPLEPERPSREPSAPRLGDAGDGFFRPILDQPE